MEGIAIQVPNVDWSGNNVGKVTIEGGTQTIDTQVLYAAYITATGRPATPEILNLMNDLVAMGLTPTDTSIFYLAAADDNDQRILSDVFDVAKKMKHSGAYDGWIRVGPQGARSNKDQWGNTGKLSTPNYTVTSGIFTGMIMTSAGKQSQSWSVGGDYSKGGIWTYSTGGGLGEFLGRSIRDKDSKANILKTDDPTEPTGVIVMGSNITGPHVYKHNDMRSG